MRFLRDNGHAWEGREEEDRAVVFPLHLLSFSFLGQGSAFLGLAEGATRIHQLQALWPTPLCAGLSKAWDRPLRAARREAPTGQLTCRITGRQGIHAQAGDEMPFHKRTNQLFNGTEATLKKSPVTIPHSLCEVMWLFHIDAIFCKCWRQVFHGQCVLLILKGQGVASVTARTI